ncbi:MAG: UDP-N-acetylglucosamine 1-carboxyvinyltransferase [Candidatus Nomurabacteria bacterium]|jgi:UDP-N-acetylglucosamine 1-carboxyvinyltransferase|nr:UDP-N-acetylglucosamine 1-carboxyvinyltransferase [Candidatus Nomurabacteria bacterium]
MTTHSYLINGGRELQGTVTLNASKNGVVGCLMASLVNQATTTLHNIPRIEEAHRLIEVLRSLDVTVDWVNDGTSVKITPPDSLRWENLDTEAARKTRSAIMLMGSFLHFFKSFQIPFAGGCTHGERTVEPHLQSLSNFGLTISDKCTDGFYQCTVTPTDTAPKRFVLIERGDTVTENALIAAALFDGETTIKNASSNYMVQEVCFFLQTLGVEITGIGTTNLTIHGKPVINQPTEYHLSEDPIEAMSFLAAGIITHSEITISRAPLDFLEIELALLKEMGLSFDLSPTYKAANNHTNLADIHLHKSTLTAPIDKIHPMPFPGLNIDNLPFFAAISAVANGRTLIHDWVFENRIIYLTELQKLGVKLTLIDAHRMYIDGPTHWHSAELVAPPALRPAVVLTIAMLAAPDRSILRNIYPVQRGYQDFAKRLASLGADITVVES